MKKNCFSEVCFNVALMFVLAGCKSPPSEKEVYIPPEYAELMRSSEQIPFQKAWGKPELIREYDKIKIAVVNSPTQLETSWWGGNNIRYVVSSQADDMKYVANYASESFIKAFEKSKLIKLTGKKGPKTLALEFAIVQIVPNKPILGAISNLSNLTPIGLILLPVKMGAKSSSGDGGGAIAMECVLRDSQTGKILAVFSDREKGKVALFNAREFTAYGNVRAIIDAWTTQIVIALNQIKEGRKVEIKDGEAFTPLDY
jgi:hypothetical protein